jgi:DNA-binding IclR family transcriptional regulator
MKQGLNMQDKKVQVIDRALDILEILSSEKDGLGVTEIGNRIGLHKSTVYRIVTALGERGYIEKVSDKGIYKIGLKLVEISSIYLNNVELKTEARPYLRELARRLGQPVHLAILDGNDAVYIEKVDVENSIRLYSQIGKRIPVHCSALGKSLLQGLSDYEIEDRLKNYKFHKFSHNTILSKDELMKQINVSRLKGWSIDDEEHDEGIRCIAAPIFDYRGKIIAALSVTGPVDVFYSDRYELTAERVIETSVSISKRLGYRI